LDKLIEKTIDESRIEQLRERKHKLEYELRTASITSEYFKVLKKIVKNNEEYEKLLEQKKKGEFVDDLITQNRYTSKELAKLDKELSDRNKTEVEMEKKRTGEERPDRPVMRATVMANRYNLGARISRYDAHFLSQPQTKKARKLIDNVVKGFNLNRIPEVKIYGYNFTERVNTLELKRASFRARALKEIDRQIKYTKNNDDIIIAFDIKTHLKKLVYFQEFMPAAKFYANQTIWLGILSFQIPGALLFGRVANRVQHGGGKYFFAPIDYNIIGVENIINRSGLPIEKFVEQERFISLLNKFRYSSQAIKFIKAGYNRLKSKIPSEYSLINKLNDNSKLIKLLKKISHFGTVEYLTITKYASDCDVSMFFSPCLNRTLFLVCDFKTGNKHTLPAINTLTRLLRDYR